MSVFKSKVVLNLDKKQGLLSKHGARIAKSGRQQTAVAEAASSKRGLVLRLSNKCWATFLMWGGSFLAACWPLTVQGGEAAEFESGLQGGFDFGVCVCFFLCRLPATPKRGVHRPRPLHLK